MEEAHAALDVERALRAQLEGRVHELEQEVASLAAQAEEAADEEDASQRQRQEVASQVASLEEEVASLKEDAARNLKEEKARNLKEDVAGRAHVLSEEGKSAEGKAAPRGIAPP